MPKSTILFSQLPQAVGWAAESFIGPWLYDIYAAKETLSRAYMQANGYEQAAIDAVPVGEAFDYLVASSGQTAEAITKILYEANNVGMVWELMAIVAFVTSIGLFFYGKWVMTIIHSDRQPA